MNKTILEKIVFVAIGLIMVMGCLFQCSASKEEILIYTSAEDYRIEYLKERLEEEFPQYDVIVEYMSTGSASAKLLFEGDNTQCDILWSIEYAYMEQLAQAGVFADVSDYDKTIYVEDAIQSDYYLPEYRNGGAIILNTQVLEARGLSKPTCYEDLLKEEYKGLISMPSPKASGTGYMFYKSLVNAWGDEKALAYFDGLTENILQYTSSGSGPVNALVQGEAAIGLGMTGQAVTKINEGEPLEILFFEEGSPYALYGEAMIAGKDKKDPVKEVFTFLVEEFNYEQLALFFPEKIYADKDFEVENYPKDIQYSDMSNSSSEEKIRLLGMWKY